MPKNTIILFDLDGTLIDSTEAILESFGVAYETHGSIVPNDIAIKELIGLPLDEMFVRLGVPDKYTDSYVKAYKLHYRTVHTTKTDLLEGARDAITVGYTIAHIGIVTTKTSKYSIELLEHFGLMQYISVLIGRDEVTRPKPDPEPIIKALEMLPSVTGSSYMVGDTCIDMDAALAAGITGIGVTCGYSSPAQIGRCADIVLNNATEAVNMISNDLT